MKLKLLFLCAALVITATVSHAQLTLLSNFAANQSGGFSAGEIAAFDKGTDRLFVTSSGSSVFRVNIFDMAIPSAVTSLGTIDFSTAFGLAADMRGLSSVAVDPLGRFGVAALLPKTNTTTLGKVGFFNLSTGAAIGTADVGYHPDSLTFSADGSKLIVVNEGEFNNNLQIDPGDGNAGTNPSLINAPGSISVFDVSGINSGNLATLPGLTATTRDFTAGNLASGVSLSGVRNSNVTAVGFSGTFINTVPDFTNAANIDPNAIEPEYASVIGDKVYVSLQDNNAIAEYDLTTNQWTDITNLGTIENTIDATDQNNAGQTDNLIAINKAVKGMPMPDTVATYEVGGKTYVVSANEGDARVDSRDASRFGDTGGNDDMDPLLDDNYPTNATGVRATGELGRLTVSRIDGDTDADGKIDEIRAFGTRSFSIWEMTASGLVLAYDSDNFFETYISLNDAAGWVDSRSDDKGPEPEGLTLGEIDGRTYAFIGMERNHGIFMVDITDPTNAVFVDYDRISTGNIPLRPESLSFVSAADSPNGQNLLIVGFEGDGSGASNERIAIYSVVPEPSTALLLGVAGVALALRRRARRVAA
ncbi:MAG: choice-of-anchor I family protein [Terrimicrobiaceae bacterium]